MSIARGNEITCIDCGNKQNFTVWHSINVDADPELREKVKNRSLFEFTCKKCGSKFNVEYPTLYHDTRNGFMIQYFPDNATEEQVQELEEASKNGTFKYFERKDYIFRKVFDKNSLIETINIFEHHLDDVVVNILKIIMYNQSAPEVKAVINRMFFSQIKDGFIEFFILKNDNTTTGCKIPLEEYESLKNDVTLKEVEKWQCITMNNAGDYIIN